MPYDDPKTGMHFEFEWQDRISRMRKAKCECPFMSGKRVWPGYNDLASNYPEIAAQWHPTKNGGLTPFEVPTSSGKSVWWLLQFDDPETGKHFDFEWQDIIDNRTKKGRGCPFVSGKKVWFGYNDLSTKYPEVAIQWHPVKNGNLKPDAVTASSNKKVWWIFRYDDPDTGKHFDFEWQDYIYNRSQNGYGCPFISGRRIWPDYNDLESNYPSIAAEWHPTKNRNKTPKEVHKSTHDKYWWLCSSCGKEWRCSVYDRTMQGVDCPERAIHLDTEF